MKTKIEFRKDVKKINAAMNPVSKAFESMGYCLSLVQSDIFKKASVIFGFMSMKDEVDVLPVMRTALEQKKKVLLPKMLEDSQMDFYYITGEPNEQTEQNKWGISEPLDSLEKADIEKICSSCSDGDILVLVPGLAFGSDHSRLGRGKGYYDRFLKRLKGKCSGNPVFVGVSYKSCVFDSVPTDDNDFFMDKLIAEL